MGNPQAEPSMDEILASIRRIIAEEDDTPKARTPVREKLETLELKKEQVAPTAAKPAQTAAKPTLRKPQPQVQPEPEPEVEELEEEIVAEVPDFDLPEEEFVEDEPAMEEVAAEEAYFEDEVDEEAYEPEPEPVMVKPAARPTVAPRATAKVAEAVQTRAARVAEAPLATGISSTSAEAASSAFEALAENIRISDGAGTTLDDMVQAMLQPLLVQWLDENLPRIVQDKVEEEVRRLARRR